MKQSQKLIALLSIFSLSTGISPLSEAQNPSSDRLSDIEQVESLASPDTVRNEPRDLSELLAELDKTTVTPPGVMRITGPWIFTGYRQTKSPKKFEMDYASINAAFKPGTNDSIFVDDLSVFAELDTVVITPSAEELIQEFEERKNLPLNQMIAGEFTPAWLREAIRENRRQEDLMYNTMIYHPSSIDYAYWDLPEPPVLPEDDISFGAYIRKLVLPDVETDKAILPEQDIRKIHWLHNFNASAQFSQAYVSSNWYQGGNNHLALLLGANWNVQLNQVYHPNLLFQSNLSYKLGLNSTPQDQVHKYSLSEDLFQWNLNTGLKALKKWYYSFNAQFKTQIFKNYLPNSDVRKASFLSPGDFNMGLGMSYSNKKPNIEFTATISPFSYNLKTCISNKIGHEQFNIKPDRNTHSEFGSNAEFNMNWKIMWNITYKTRLFLFSDYKYFLADWEHTLNFDINRFLSTQIYVHMRYDGSSDPSTKWKHFMMREVLSFGLSYSFSTK